MSFPLNAQTNMAIYTDSLQNSWADWSWTSTRDFNSTAYVHSGANSISVTFTAAWAALSLEHSDINSSTYSDLTFWINGGSSGGQSLQVYAEAPPGTGHPAITLAPLPAITWQKITLSLASLGVANQPNFSRFSIQDHIGSAQSTFYVDDIALVTNTTPSPSVTLTSPTGGSSYAAPASINLAATVVTNSHTITKVQFYNGANLLNEDSSPPYSYSWTGVGVGTYGVFARVVYDAGATVDSTTANVTVTGTTPGTIAVDAQLNQRPISPYIYGVAFAPSASTLLDLNAPVHRSGGNAETRYNWLIDAHNRGADWYFESIADSSGTPALSDDSFISTSKAGGAEPLITIPMIGWAPKLGSGRSHLASFSVAKYGAQTATDPYWSDAGSGLSSPGGAKIVNDPLDANFPTNSDLQYALVQHFTNQWGMAGSGGVRFYLLDNEHSIWHETHRDVHPIGATMQEIRDKMIDCASRVKSVDPNALVCGPEEFGWSGYFYSGYDLQNSGGHDRANNGGWDYVPWLLDQMRQHDTGTGQRLLDYFTLHRYTEDGQVGGTDVSTTVQLRRNRATRSFWDTNYVDETWIGSQTINIVKLIPRMKGWVASYYPGTKLGITEYNWGAEGHINGATTQGDILGIFGREGLDLATRWTTPDSSTPTYKAMKIYRNYDGNKSTFGDTSVSATGPNPDNVSTFAAVRSSDGALTLMVINKQLTSASALTVNLANYTPSGAAQVWQLTSANTIMHLSDVSLTGNTLSATVPAQSITLFVVPGTAAILAPPPVLVPASGLSSSNTFNFWLTNGVAGQSYVILSSTDLLTWLPIQTNTLTTSSNNYAFPAPDAMRLYRAQWAP